MSEWQPIKTAPKDGDPVWVLDSDEDIYRIRWDKTQKQWVDLFGNMVFKRRYWMPLDAIPEPPK